MTNQTGKRYPPFFGRSREKMLASGINTLKEQREGEGEGEGGVSMTSVSVSYHHRFSSPNIAKHGA